MKKILLTLLAMSTLMVATAQTHKCANDTRTLIADELAAGATQLDFLAKMVQGYDRAALEKEGITIGAEAGNIVTLHVPVDKLGVLESNKQIVQYSISHRIALPECNDMRFDTRTDSVQAGLGTEGNLPYTGRGVYVGITDWGFDYTNPNYNAASLDNLRLVRVWDHFRLAGPHPEGFTYGTEFSALDDLLAAQSDTSNLYKIGTHGTHVAGIAAGRGKNGNYRGQAPNAELLFCSFGLGESQWLEAVQWMRRVAADSNRRLVINSSWGMYSFSTLDGTSLLSQAINNWADSGTVFVTSAGNNGHANFHLSHSFTPDAPGDTLRSVCVRASDIYVTREAGQALVLWGDANTAFSAAIRMKNYQGEFFETPFVNTADGDTTIVDTLVCGSHRIAYRFIVEQQNPFNDCPNMRIEVAKSTTMETHLLATADSCMLHAWNLNLATNRAGNSGCHFAARGNAGYSSGDALYAISEPGCAAKNITVAAHKSRTWNADSTAIVPGGIANFSSSGPILNSDMQKPEISAPGYEIVSSINYFSTSADEYPAVMEWRLGNGRKYKWAAMSGTSMSSPSVTGVVALILEANPALTTDEVRDIITSTARNDDSTGALLANGTHHLRWGWGKIDALAAVNEAVRRVGIEQAERMAVALKIYPNPATNLVTVLTGCGAREQLAVYTTDGRLFHSEPVVQEALLDVTSWPRGIYILRIGTRTGKLVVR